MSHESALDWISTLVEVSVGLYVFLITIPALIYSTFAPEELKKLHNNKVNEDEKDNFGKNISYLIFLIVILATIHFMWVSMVHWDKEMIKEHQHLFCCVSECDGKVCTFSLLFVILITFLFLVLLAFGANFYIKSSNMRGYFEKAIEETKSNLIKSYPVHKKIKSKSSRDYISKKKAAIARAHKTEIFWGELEILGKHSNPGRQKKIWINAINEIIFHLIENDTQYENLKKAISILGEVVGDDADSVTHDNIKDTINIYRSLLLKLSRKDNVRNIDVDQFSECYEEMANHMLTFFRITISEDDIHLLPTIVSTLSLFPNASSTLFQICVEALEKNKYDILVYALNEIVDTGSNRSSWINNFWGIYAALYIKGGAFKEYAEQIRKKSGVRSPKKATLKSAYQHHFENANFNIANVLHEMNKDFTNN